MADTFSDRRGYKGTDAEIRVREDAPEALRYAIRLIAQATGIGILDGDTEQRARSAGELRGRAAGLSGSVPASLP